MRATGAFLGLVVGSLPFSLWGQPKLAAISDLQLLAGSPLHLPLDGDGSGTRLRYAAIVTDELVSARILEGNRSLRIEVSGHGEMLFELFDDRVRRVTNRIVQLADRGFYDGVLFHRVIDDFVIQGGDPTGTGSGGSSLGNFPDRFHVDLQHNRTGLLSMAKTAFDDTNDSQFFVTEGPQRELDFNHSIFGLLVEGEEVRERISEVSVGRDDRPLEPVVMRTVRSFVDEENAVLMLKASEGATGAVDVTVVVTNERGQEARRTFRVEVVPDPVNSPPFLADVPDIVTSVDRPVSYQLQAVDVEGDPAHYLDQASLAVNGLAVPVQAHPDLRYGVDFETGLLTIQPTQGITGRYLLTVATAVSAAAVDYEIVTVIVEP